MNVTPRSSARWIVAIDSSQSAWPYHSLMPMQPRPWAGTVSPLSETSRMSVLPLYVAAGTYPPVTPSTLGVRAHSNANDQPRAAVEDRASPGALDEIRLDRLAVARVVTVAQAARQVELVQRSQGVLV